MARFQLLKRWHDIEQDTLICCDEDGHAGLMTSTYTHSGAGLSYLSRAYYSAGELRFVPEIEPTSERSGTADDKKAGPLVILKAEAAERCFFEAAGMCVQE